MKSSPYRLKAALILVFGLLMTVGAIIALGSAMPTAQEASNYFGFIIMLLMAPFFVMPMLGEHIDGFILTQ